MTSHLLQHDIERLALNDLNTTEWIRVRNHLFECDFCLRRLIHVDVMLVAPDAPVKPRQVSCRAYVY